MRNSSTDRAVPFVIGGGTEPRADARASAMAEGYAAGWAQGMREARAASAAARERASGELDRLLQLRDEAAATAVAAVSAAAERLRATTVQRAEEITESVLDAAVELAEALLGAELAADVVEAARHGVRRAVRTLPPSEPVRVRLHPADLAELGEPDREALGAGRRVTFVADHTLSRGDAVAETALTTVDATLGSAVRRVRAELVP